MLNTIIIRLCYEIVCIRTCINLIFSVLLFVKDRLFRRNCSLCIFDMVIEVKKYLSSQLQIVPSSLYK